MRVLLFCLLYWALPAWSAGSVVLHLGKQRVVAEIAASYEERERGLMGRASLPSNSGMLFVFPLAGHHAMWMKNTVLPLSAAFIDQRGVIVSIADMQPLSLTEHRPPVPVRYILEMPQHWFAERQIRSGQQVAGLAALGSAR